VTEAHVNPYHDFSQRSEVTPRVVSSAQLLDAAGSGTEGKSLGKQAKEVEIMGEGAVKRIAV
jgi:hypothetical protein